MSNKCMTELEPVVEMRGQLLNFELPWFERLELVKQVSDIKILGEVLEQSPEPEIRTAIVHQIDNQQLLEKVCYEDEDPSVRRHAASKLQDENSEVLRYLIKHDTDHSVRKIAVIKIHQGYQKILHRVMIDDDHTEVRKKAIKKLNLNQLTEQELVELCISGREPLVRKGAIYNLNNEALLKEVALSGGDYKIIEIAVSKIENEDYLKEIAQYAEFAHGRYSAIYKLSDQAFIGDICLSDDNLEVQKSCIEQIDNIEILARLRIEGSTDIQPLIKNKLLKLS